MYDKFYRTEPVDQPLQGCEAHGSVLTPQATNGAGGAAPTQVQAHQPQIPVGGGGNQAAGHVVVADAVEAVAANALLPPCPGQQLNGVQGGLVVERGQGDEGLQESPQVTTIKTAPRIAPGPSVAQLRNGLGAATPAPKPITHSAALLPPAVGLH